MFENLVTLSLYSNMDSVTSFLTSVFSYLNPSGPLVLNLQYFHIFDFVEIFACAKKLHGVFDTAESKMIPTMFPNVFVFYLTMLFNKMVDIAKRISR